MTGSTPRSRTPMMSRRVAPVGIAAAVVATLAGCSASTTSPEEAVAPTDASYRDGSYQADGAYQSPAGDESIIVVLEFENDVVTDVQIGLYPTSATSSKYQSEFALGIADAVVGRDIDQLDVTVVAGSSLTSIGFREAVESIKAEALEG